MTPGVILSNPTQLNLPAAHQAAAPETISFSLSEQLLLLGLGKSMLACRLVGLRGLCQGELLHHLLCGAGRQCTNLTCGLPEAFIIAELTW
jgi:hypothetical protein